jgi:hypothetical protein
MKFVPSLLDLNYFFHLSQRFYRVVANSATFLKLHTLLALTWRPPESVMKLGRPFRAGLIGRSPAPPATK